jgi:hypothetical protein|tara:strand:- start:33767 stop:33940 length:174 start_codon:yes stop_codon:yes gene_type:complete
MGGAFYKERFMPTMQEMLATANKIDQRLRNGEKPEPKQPVKKQQKAKEDAKPKSKEE